MNNDFINIEKLISVFSTDFEKTLISFLPKALFFSDKLNKAMYYVVKVFPRTFGVVVGYTFDGIGLISNMFYIPSIQVVLEQ